MNHKSASLYNTYKSPSSTAAFNMDDVIVGGKKAHPVSAADEIGSNKDRGVAVYFFLLHTEEK